MISKRKIKARARKKSNPVLLETIKQAYRNKGWMKVAQKLSSSTRKYDSVNLEKIDKESKAGDTIIILGKVLSVGKLAKKLRICALSFSASALKKMKETKSEAVSILDEIKSNPKAQGIKIIG